MNIRILGANNTETLRTRHTCLLIDDTLAIDAGALTSHLSTRGFARLKAVLLTHSHYDHIRDLPALAINIYLQSRSIVIYSHRSALDNLAAHFLNDVIYPSYHKKPAERPTLNFHVLEHLKATTIEGYSVLPVKVNHAITTMGYQITSPEGKSIFYTGDTGRRLDETWKKISPDILFIEVTASNRWEDKVNNNGHLTPNLLQKELFRFNELNGYYPQTIAVHLNHYNEKEIKSELKQTGENLGINIQLAKKGMEIQL